MDQGFWPYLVYTAPTDAAPRYDDVSTMQLGLVANRKHIKVEPERFYYWCDKLGQIVTQDIPSGNAGDPSTDQPKDTEGAEQNEMAMRWLIRRRWNHPSIVSWVMFNEGWGQLYDVETEVNGFMTYDRAVWKVDPATFRRAVRGERP